MADNVEKTAFKAVKSLSRISGPCPLISVSCSDSYKDIKRFSKSVVFNVSDFKNKMNEVNSILNVLENASDDEILETIQIEFLGFNFLNEPSKRQSARKARKNFK